MPTEAIALATACSSDGHDGLRATAAGHRAVLRPQTAPANARFATVSMLTLDGVANSRWAERAGAARGKAFRWHGSRGTAPTPVAPAWRRPDRVRSARDDEFLCHGVGVGGSCDGLPSGMEGMKVVAACGGSTRAASRFSSGAACCNTLAREGSSASCGSGGARALAGSGVVATATTIASPSTHLSSHSQPIHSTHSSLHPHDQSSINGVAVHLPSALAFGVHGVSLSTVAALTSEGGAGCPLEPHDSCLNACARRNVTAVDGGACTATCAQRLEEDFGRLTAEVAAVVTKVRKPLRETPPVGTNKLGGLPPRAASASVSTAKRRAVDRERLLMRPSSAAVGGQAASADPSNPPSLAWELSVEEAVGH